MPTPYSYDLRKKAIEALQRGEKKIEVCRLFKISRNTLDLWLKRAEKTGDFRATTGSQKGGKPKIKDGEKFQQFLRRNSDKTQQQIAELWGDNLTQQNVSDACQKLGITRKKRVRNSEVSSECKTHSRPTYGYQEREPEARAKFIKQLEDIEEHRIVYVDEAGFDNREDYPYGYSPKGERCYALKSGKRRERASWISALKEGKLFAPLTFEGSCKGTAVGASQPSLQQR